MVWDAVTCSIFLSYINQPCWFWLHCLPYSVFLDLLLGHSSGSQAKHWMVSQFSPACRSQAQESNYENLNQMNPPGHQLPRVCREELLGHHQPVVHHEK